MTDVATRDLIRVGPALVAAGDTTHYRQFVQETTARFAGTRNPVAAEHVLRVSLSTGLALATATISAPRTAYADVGHYAMTGKAPH